MEDIGSQRIRRSCWLLGVLVWAGLGFVARAQVTPGLPYSSAVQTFAQSWRIEEGGVSQDISQIVAPIGVFLPVTDGVEARLTTSYVSLTRQFATSPTGESVSGLSDLKIQVNAAFLERQLLIGTAFNLPTGQKELSGEQQDIILAFIASDLSVRANRISEGLNIGATASYALPISNEAAVAVGAGFVVRGPYDTRFPTLANEVTLTPGNEFTLTASLLQAAGVNQIRASIAYTLHGMEQVNDVDVFRLGPRLAADLFFTRPFEANRGTFTLGFQNLFRFEHTQGGEVELADVLDTDGNYLIGTGSVGYAANEWLRLDLSGTGRFISTNSQGVGDATVIDGGLSATFSPTTQVDVTLGGRFVVGSGTGLDGSDRSIQGLEGQARLALRF